MGMRTRRMFGVLSLAGALLFGGIATSGQTTVGDGLVNVAVGDVTVQDINVAAAIPIVVNACGVNVGVVVGLVTAVDRSGRSRTVCTTQDGPVTISQN